MKIQGNNIPPKPSFKGVSTPKSHGMFVFDLDETLLRGSKDEIRKVLQTAHDRNSTVVYATGRTKEEVETLKDLPAPNYLVSCTDGTCGAIYKNTNGGFERILEDKNPKSKAEGILMLNEILKTPHGEIIAAGDYLNDISMAYLTHLGASFVCVGNAHMALKSVAMELAKQGLCAYSAKKEGAAGILEGFENLLDKKA